ncbi:hypothetical protein OFO01_03055 [Campylobacter sp. JMF_01 NE2]|uniref:hypothetical protein n=1 Tax=unclassified Campylobacter TaxID=2593542 RepID=UPI0022E9E926|nr:MULTISPECIES: hypothetical protein [unclassified Campylobacter]MDA3052421.1 hypothetical protein [Campylobacter sp. JMF_03 NE3]MDA3066755.1 hypothetical protein [Campylobacter sp. JMF_01 NE2]
MSGENSTYPLMGTRFVLDEEKILREGKYRPETLYAQIDKIAAKCNMQKADKNTYYAIRGENGFSDLGSFAYVYLIKEKWFIDNVKEWLWLDEEEGDEDMMGDVMEVKQWKKS